MRRITDHGRYCRTGGTSSRDFAFIRCATDKAPSDWFAVIDCGGPLDAPEEMPAGACDSITIHNGAKVRTYYPASSTVRRG